MRTPRRSRRGETGWTEAGRAAGPRLVAAVAALALAVPGAGAGAQEKELDVPYVPTPMPVVDQMLELAEPTPEDSLYDLGSGDGRIVIRAAGSYGTPGVGIELDASRVEVARERTRQEGVEELVRFVRGDLFEAELGGASVVTLYLLTTVNRRLRPKLLRELRPGSRVVSHDFDMGEWRPDTVVSMPEESSIVYFWVVPANVAGTWEVTVEGGRSFTLELRQKYQEVRARVSAGLGSVPADATPALRGDSVAFTVTTGGTGGTVRFVGRVEGAEMRGTTSGGRRWSAARVSGGGQPLERWHGGRQRMR